MNRLDSTERAHVLHLLCEGSSIRAISRLTGASKNTIAKLLVDAGQACADFQDRAFRDLPCRRLQLDEIWTFTFCKEQNKPTAHSAPKFSGDTWTWTAICADTKLVPCWHVGARHSHAAFEFVSDLATRLKYRVQITSDGHKAYMHTVPEAFENDVDFSMLVKLYGPTPGGERRYSPPTCIGARKRRVVGNPDPRHVSTSFAERQNLTMRMQSRRFTRLTNGFSKKLENHAHAVALHFMYYNFVRIHQTLKITPAMAAKVTNRLWEISDVVEVIENWETAKRPALQSRERSSAPQTPKRISPGFL